MFARWPRTTPVCVRATLPRWSPQLRVVPRPVLPLSNSVAGYHDRRYDFPQSDFEPMSLIDSLEMIAQPVGVITINLPVEVTRRGQEVLKRRYFVQGATVCNVSVVSYNPPLLAFSMRQSQNQIDAAMIHWRRQYQESTFVINMLADDQENVAQAFRPNLRPYCVLEQAVEETRRTTSKVEAWPHLEEGAEVSVKYDIPPNQDSPLASIPFHMADGQDSWTHWSNAAAPALVKCLKSYRCTLVRRAKAHNMFGEYEVEDGAEDDDDFHRDEDGSVQRAAAEEHDRAFDKYDSENDGPGIPTDKAPMNHYIARVHGVELSMPSTGRPLVLQGNTFLKTKATKPKRY